MSALRSLAAGLIALVAASLAGSSESVEAPALRIATAGDASSGALAGFEADFAAALCTRIGADCAFIPAAAGDPVAPLLEQKVDAVIAGLPVRPQDRGTIDFTRTYAEPSHGFAVRAAGPLADLPGDGKTLSASTLPADTAAMFAVLDAALAGKAIGAMPGSVDLDFLESHFRNRSTIVASANPFGDLAAGRLDAVMIPVTTLDEPSAGLRFAGPRFREDAILGFGIAIGLRKSDRALRDRLDRAIAEMIADGSLRQLSLARFGQDITPHLCSCKPF